jgi:lactoylglutathione lyase
VTIAPSFYSVAIFVQDIARAIDFYGTRLGLPIVKQGSFGAEIFEGPTRIGIHPAVHTEAQALVGRHTGITLRVPGLLHYCGQLHDRGVRFIAEPTQQAWGVMAMIADPDGNVLALWEEQEQEEAPPA